jgi:hypothetical protein
MNAQRFILPIAAALVLAPSLVCAQTFAGVERNIASQAGLLEAIERDSERASGKAYSIDAQIETFSIVEDVVASWQPRYPSDLWLPRALISVERVFRKIDDDRTRAAERHDASTAVAPV